jgi:hypothetical protein
MKLHLGVIDVPEPYGDKSTGDVGVDLEKRYGLFSMFYNAHKQDIADSISKDAAVGLEMMLANQDVQINKVFAVSSEHITDEMHKFITSQEVERVASMYGEQGIPTQAALEGRSFRFDKGYTAKRQVKGLKGKGKQFIKKNPRPSFIYSGVLEASLKGWIE